MLPLTTTILVGAVLAMWEGHAGGHVTALVLFVVALLNEAGRAAVTRPPGPLELPERQRTPITYDDE